MIVNLSGYDFLDNETAVPYDLGKMMLDMIRFGLSDVTNMSVGTKTFWWPEFWKYIEQKVKDGTARPATGANKNFQIPNKQLQKIKNINQDVTRITN